MIRKATEQDKSALREIWGAAFNDQASYADFIIDHCLKLGTVLYYDEGSSCLTLFPLTLQHKGTILMQGFYIYGLATHPGQQGKGFGSRLLAYALEDAPFYLLYPATPELQRFYHKRGFTTPVRIPDAVSRKLTVPGVQDIHSKLLYRQYLENAGNQDFVFLWSAPLFDFAIGECFFRKGFISPPFFCYPEEDQVLCKPFLSAANSGEYSYLHGRAKFNVPFPGFDTEKSTFYLPLD